MAETNAACPVAPSNSSLRDAGHLPALQVSEWTQQIQPWTLEDDARVASNWDVIEAFLHGLVFPEDSGSDQRTVDQRNALADHIPLLSVLENLLVRIWFSWRDAPNFSAAELAIQWYLRSNPDASATVYRMADQRSPLPGGGSAATDRRARADRELVPRRGPRSSCDTSR